jgi:uncharacterized protein YkwD
MNMKANVILAAAWLTTASGASVAAAPSESEQLWLEMINRFRAQPRAELDLLTKYVTPGIGTTFATPSSPDPGVRLALSFYNVNAAVLRSQFDALSAAPPLAWNANLHSAAAAHTSAMIAADQQSHQLPGEPDLAQRLTNAGYAYTAASENVYGYVDNVFHGHAAFVIDWGNAPNGIQDPPGHRDALVDPGLREIGISLQESSGPELGPFVVTQDLGRRSGNPFLTGVAFTDAIVADTFYSLGEGLGSLAVNVFDASRTQLLASTTTFASGGYALALATGTYDVQFAGGGYDFFVDDYAFTTGENQKLDFIAAQVPEPATAVLMLCGVGVLAAVGRRFRRQDTA